MSTLKQLEVALNALKCVHQATTIGEALIIAEHAIADIKQMQRRAALQELADQAQELDMGYGDPK